MRLIVMALLNRARSGYLTANNTTTKHTVCINNVLKNKQLIVFLQKLLQ